MIIMEFINFRSTCLLCFGTIGAASAVYSVVYMRKLVKKLCNKKTSMKELADTISLSTLGKLSQVSNVSVRLGAYNIILTRASTQHYLKSIVQWCYADDELCVLKACTVLECLTKVPQFRSKVVNCGGLEALSHAMYRSWTKKTIVIDDCEIQRLACIAIFDLVSDDEQGDPVHVEAKICLVDKNPSFIPTLLGIMKTTRDRDVEKWGLCLIHQIAVCECTREKLKDRWDVIAIIARLVMKSQGETLRLRLAFQVLVTLANVLMANTEELVLQEIKKCGVIQPAIACLKSDNSELVYWAVGLIHEFAINNVGVDEICNIPVLLKSLYSVLVSSEAALQRLILRVLRYLSESSSTFQTSVVHYKQLLARLPVCLASGDEDLVTWSLFLIHDVAKTGIEAIQLLFQHSKGVIEALAQLSLKNVNTQDANTRCRYIAETLGFFCSLETIQCEVVQAGALKAVLVFAMMEDVDIRFWSTSLLLNLSMSADILKEVIVKEGGVRALIDLAVSDTDEPQIAMQAAKTLIMLGFIDTPFRVGLTSSGFKTSCSILINETEYSPDKLGINMVVVDPMSLNVVEVESFDTGHNPDASLKLVEFIHTLPLMSLVFTVVKGEANYFLTEDAKDALSQIGLTGYSFTTGELWVLSGQKRSDNEQDLVNVQFEKGYDLVELSTAIAQGYYVNEQVEALIMAPLLDILMSTPPESNISKVSELELLTVLARHDNHRKVMLKKEGFLSYMTTLIWNMGSRTLNDLRSNPMLVAHCIGAMKTVSGLLLSADAVARCLECGVIKEVIRLLILMNGVVLQAQAPKDKGTLRNQDLSFTSVSYLGVEEKAPFSSVNDTSTRVSQTTLNEAPDEELSCSYEDFEEAFVSLTQLSVTILYHCNRYMEDSVYTTLSVHVLWCTLLSCGSELRRALAIPIENIITSCGSRRRTLMLNPERVPVCLDHKGMTRALMLSSDRYEVINFNWSFESVHATHAVGRKRHQAGPNPAGWYYEVQVKTQGIMQIGWRTDLCKYGPEKGDGVGDDKHSCAFDGARMKIWSGPVGRQVGNDYGKEWVVDDIVSCLFSWDGQISFWLNGEDLGVAFDHMDPEVDHYPGASFSMDQHCSFNFGGDKSFSYAMPEGYIAVNEAIGRRVYSRRPRSKSYTKGSFESIAEEDEEEAEDLKNIHISRLQRCSSSEPSLHSTDSVTRHRHASSNNDGKRRLSSDGSPYHPDLPSTSTRAGRTSPTPSTPMTPLSRFWSPSFERQSPGGVPNISSGGLPTAGTSPTPSTPFTPVTPLSPFWSPVFEHQSSDLFQSFPCVYFEAEVNDYGCRARNIGYFHSTSGESTSCEFYESQNMTFPSQDIGSFNIVRAPSVIGCGLLWPSGVFFTLDGVFSNNMYQLPCEKFEVGDILPYISCAQVKVNYGQEPFLFRQCNGTTNRLTTAQLLHSMSCQLLDSFHA